jgi:type VI secretion system secreted protein VgrG
MTPGHVFALTEHPEGEMNRAYLVTSAAYEIDVRDFPTDKGGRDPRKRVNGEQAEQRFACTFGAQDDKRPFRPARATRKPVVQGPQTAVVTGPKGKEIYTDKYGRVKVHFHWDRHGAADEKSSCWLRVSMPWAGKGWGGVQIPRIGQEVIVDFLEGDPDRPLIVGRVYNGESMPPLSGAGRPGDPPRPTTMEQAAQQMSLRSNSLGQGGGAAKGNEITMNDDEGGETLFIHAEKDETHNVNNDRKDTVGNNEVIFIGNDRTDTVGNNETRTVNNDRTRTVVNNENIVIGVNQSISVGSNQSTVVGANQTINVNANRSLTVAANNSDTVGASETRTIGAAQTNTVGSNQSTSVGIMRSLSVGLVDQVEAGVAAIIHAGVAVNISAGVELVLSAPGGTITIDASGIKIKAKKILIEGDRVDINP